MSPRFLPILISWIPNAHLLKTSRLCLMLHPQPPFLLAGDRGAIFHRYRLRPRADHLVHHHLNCDPSDPKNQRRLQDG